MSINVNRDVNDQFYRYKMPKLVAKVEGKGNGIKTVIVNMPDVAKALSCPPSYPTKYFGCELGAQTLSDQKNDRYIVNGSHTVEKLQDLLHYYIKKFVLCTECSNPETVMKVNNKRGTVGTQCKACGHSGQLDLAHRLTTFIIKNPPDVDNSSTPNPKGKRRQKRAEGSEKNGDCSPDHSESADEEDEDWGEDTSENAMHERMQQLTLAAAELTRTVDLEKTPKERVDTFYKFIKERLHDDLLKNDKEAMKEVFLKARQLDIEEKAPLILVELLYDENIKKQVKPYRSLMLKFVHQNERAQKYLLGGLEKLLGEVAAEQLLSKTSDVLHWFYALDLLGEEVILAWHKKISKKYVSKEVAVALRKHANRFVEWLKNAEEESDEDDENDAVDFSVSGKVGAQVIEKPSEAVKEQTNMKDADTLNDEDDGDDVDIDDI